MALQIDGLSKGFPGGEPDRQVEPPGAHRHLERQLGAENPRAGRHPLQSVGERRALEHRGDQELEIALRNRRIEEPMAFVGMVSTCALSTFQAVT